jgi:hypothetical protein
MVQKSNSPKGQHWLTLKESDAHVKKLKNVYGILTKKKFQMLIDFFMLIMSQVWCSVLGETETKFLAKPLKPSETSFTMISKF